MGDAYSGYNYRFDRSIFAWQIRQAPTEKFIPVAEVVKIESGSPKAILVMNAGEPIELKEGESRQVADVFGVKVIQDSTGGLRFEDREGAEEEIGKSSVIVPEKESISSY